MIPHVACKPQPEHITGRQVRNLSISPNNRVSSKLKYIPNDWTKENYGLHKCYNWNVIILKKFPSLAQIDDFQCQWSQLLQKTFPFQWNTFYGNQKSVSHKQIILTRETLNKSDGKRQNNHGCLDQYRCNMLRLWNSRDRETVLVYEYVQRTMNLSGLWSSLCTHGSLVVIWWLCISSSGETKKLDF